MSLALVYQEAFKTIVRMQSGTLQGRTASQLQTFFLDLFGSIEDDAKHAKIAYTLDKLEDAEFALAAFADETALLSADPTISDHWNGGKGSLAQQLFNQPNAGNEFYKRLERIRRAGNAEVGELLEVYCLCLLLGFSGAKKSNEIQTLNGDVVQQVERLLGRAPHMSAGDENLSQTVRLGYDLWIQWLRRSAAAVAALAALAYVVYFITLGVLWDRVAQVAASAGVPQ